MGANLFSVTEALWKGVSTIFHPHKPRMEFKNIVLPMNLLATDEKTGKLLCSMKVQLGGGPGRRATRADVLLRMPGSGVDYNGDIQACDVCAVGKSKQKVHPKQPTYDVQHAFQLVTVDLMGPFQPAALGGYSYVTKFVDQHNKWKEIFLVKTKPQALHALELYNKALVIPNNTRLIRLRADKGTEFVISGLDNTVMTSVFC